MAIYLVQAKVQAKADGKVLFRPKVMKGVFIPKDDKASRPKIEKQCRQFLLNNLKEAYPTLTFTFAYIKIQQYNCSFTLNEDSH